MRLALARNVHNVITLLLLIDQTKLSSAGRAVAMPIMLTGRTTQPAAESFPTPVPRYRRELLRARVGEKGREISQKIKNRQKLQTQGTIAMSIPQRARVHSGSIIEKLEGSKR
jgi:hypothetical protein